MTTRRTALVVILLLAPTAWAAESTSLAVEFAAPALLRGQAIVQDTQWAVLVFYEPKDAQFSLALGPTVKATNTTVFVERQSKGPFRGDNPIPPPSMPTQFGAVDGELRFAEGEWASLIVVADSIQFSAVPSWTTAARSEPGQYMWSYLPAAPRSTYATNPTAQDANRLAQDGIVAAAEGPAPGALFGFTLDARGVRRIEWHNGTLDCSASCPDSGRPGSTQFDAQTTDVWVERLSYIALDAPQGTLAGQGQAYLSAMGGIAPRIGLAGALRLADADLSGTCPHGPCPDAGGRTFLADGNLTLSDLAPSSGHPDRLRAHLAGTFTSAAFDEASAPEFGAEIGVAAGVAIIGLAWLLKLLLGLFARNTRPLLEHPKTKAIHDLVHANPGLSFGQIVERLGFGHGTTHYHLERLIKAGLIVRHGYRNTARFFENHGVHKDDWMQHAALQKPELRSLHEWIDGHPRSNQSQIMAAAAKQWGWSRPKTQRRIRELVEAALVHRLPTPLVVEYLAVSPTRPPPNGTA